MTTNIAEKIRHRSGPDTAVIVANIAVRWTGSLALIVSWLVICLAPPNFVAAQIWSPNGPSAGSSNRDIKRESIAAIPMDRLVPEAQQKILQVVENPSFFRQLPSTTIETDPDFFILLARYPEIVAEIWKLMGVSQMKCERTGPFTLKSDDGVGTVSELELVYGTESIHIFHGTGTYTGNLIRRPVDANCVLVLRTSYGLTPTGETTAASSLDVFMKIDNAVVGLAAKTVLPLIGTTADHNFVETLKFVERLNNTTENNGPGVQGMAYRLEGLTPEVRQQFIERAGLVYDRANQRSSALIQPSQKQSPPVSRTGFSIGDSGSVNR